MGVLTSFDLCFVVPETNIAAHQTAKIFVSAVPERQEFPGAGLSFS